MKLVIERPVTVITPTIGSEKLIDAIESINNQTYKTIKHLVVVDGPEHSEHTWKMIADSGVDQKKLHLTTTPQNTGRNNFYGHRIYAAYPHLLSSDYIFFLDEDNWYHPDHVKTLVQTIEEQSLDFAYSLRKIYDGNKNYIVDDNCESLGKWPIWFTGVNGQPPQYLIDTSSFAFRREFLIQVSHKWHYGWGGDRHFYNAVRDVAKHDTNGKHTLCYRLDGNPNSVKSDFFIQGNAENEKRYKKFPWIKDN